MAGDAKKTEQAVSQQSCNTNLGMQTDTLQDQTIAYCPHCRTVTNLRVTTVPQLVARPAGSAETVILTVYQCETCRLLVRSEETGLKEECL